MKKLGKKAGQGATGKAASMKKADVPGEWLYLAPETVGVRQIADVLEGTCEMEIKPRREHALVAVPQYHHGAAKGATGVVHRRERKIGRASCRERV